MTIPKPSFTMGIEEEYLLVELGSRDLASDPPPELLAQCEDRLGDRVTAEFMRSQIEVGTRVCNNIGEARGELQELRGTVAEVAGQYGLAPIAASTHPFAQWRQQSHTDKERYDDLANALQANARRLLISGMHVHVAIEPEDMRIDLMNQATYFLPHLLALSTSSPFWGGENTGLMSYRLTVFDALPRTGVPERFDSFGEYERLVNRLVSAGVIEDGTKIWWDMRPSARYPTLEMRITDICTALEDTLTIAALYQSLLGMLHRLVAGEGTEGRDVVLGPQQPPELARTPFGQGMADFDRPGQLGHVGWFIVAPDIAPAARIGRWPPVGDSRCSRTKYAPRHPRRSAMRCRCRCREGFLRSRSSGRRTRCGSCRAPGLSAAAVACPRSLGIAPRTGRTG